MAGGLLLDDSINTADTDRSDFAERLVRPLRFRYAVVFVAVASLLLADQAVIQPLLVRLNGYAPVINLAGRQRMLSQKLAKQSLAIEFGVGESSAAARRRELSKTVEQWSTAHRVLRDGDARRGISPITTPQIAAALRDLEPDFAAMRAAASQLAAVHEPSQWLGQSLSDAPAPQTGTSPGRIVQAQTEPFTGQALPQPPVERIANADSPSDRMALVRAVLDHEADYLSGMERVVAMLEAEAQQQVAWLRLCALAAVVMAILLLASLYAFVLRPATTLIRQQLRMLAASDDRHRALAELLRRARDELELRVAERTSELSQANTALEWEMRHRQHVETRVRRLSSNLAHATRITALGQLATGLAHELNQPLGAIANYAGVCELLLEEELHDNHASRRAISEVKRSALRAGEIVRRMRNFVRRGADQASRVDLNGLVREVAELCDPELRRSDVELTLNLCGEALVVADPIQIQQVLVNLVQNALQAMRDVDGRKIVGIRTSVAAGGAQVDVADSGPGFPDEGRDDPFAPFFSTKDDGLGMGLSISQTIVEQHQGRIWAGNRPAGGAIVSFCLPLAPNHDTPNRATAHSLCG
ncbi:MAG TPA: ATP-binding protein [Pirellulales bacterium]|nr:ATP-binding protein [Pirellulales bacterium]